jgi:hypothetical protein
MKQFPDLHQLISFFEVEPDMTDTDVPYFYNKLIFQNSFGDDNIRVEIEPAFEQIQFSWIKKNITMISLHLEKIESLFIQNERNTETFIAIFQDKNGLQNFELLLRPHIQVRWGNQ